MGFAYKSVLSGFSESIGKKRSLLYVGRSIDRDIIVSEDKMVEVIINVTPSSTNIESRYPNLSVIQTLVAPPQVSDRYFRRLKDGLHNSSGDRNIYCLPDENPFMPLEEAVSKALGWHPRLLIPNLELKLDFYELRNNPEHGVSISCDGRVSWRTDDANLAKISTPQAAFEVLLDAVLRYQHFAEWPAQGTSK